MSNTGTTKTLFEEVTGKTIKQVDETFKKEIDLVERAVRSRHQEEWRHVTLDPISTRARQHFEQQGFAITDTFTTVGCGYPSDAYDICDCSLCANPKKINKIIIRWS